jgi:hypothetical protein
LTDLLNYRNGCLDRTMDPRLGLLQLRIPKPQQGSYLPPFLEPRRTSEKARVMVIQEGYGIGSLINPNVAYDNLSFENLSCVYNLDLPERRGPNVQLRRHFQRPFDSPVARQQSRLRHGTERPGGAAAVLDPASLRGDAA